MTIDPCQRDPGARAFQAGLERRGRRIRGRMTQSPWSYVNGRAQPVYWNRRTQALLIP